MVKKRYAKSSNDYMLNLEFYSRAIYQRPTFMMMFCLFIDDLCLLFCVFTNTIQMNLWKVVIITVYKAVGPLGACCLDPLMTYEAVCCNWWNITPGMYKEMHFFRDNDSVAKAEAHARADFKRRKH